MPEPPGVAVAFRYVPASSAAEVGGDWFDVIPLAGGRVAFVVGDVMGHGLGAAATMGRLRTAVRTLAGLDMPPDELLRRVNDLGDDLAAEPGRGLDGHRRLRRLRPLHPALRHRPGRPPAAGAGRAPRTTRTAARPRLLDLPTGVPLGVGGARFETTEVDVPDGAVLVLYTDGLVEARGTGHRDRHRPAARDDVPPAGVTRGRLRRTACRPCEPGREPDDVALLMARLGGMPAGSTVPGPSRRRRVRCGWRAARVRDTLMDWDLTPLSDVTMLLVSELVTNSLRYAHGPIGVRMVRGSSLLVEVSDPLPDPPRERVADDDDEGGRGLQLVGRSLAPVGDRHGPLGKTVWFELALP